jgi:hypothetical protein
MMAGVEAPSVVTSIGQSLGCYPGCLRFPYVHVTVEEMPIKIPLAPIA